MSEIEVTATVDMDALGEVDMAAMQRFYGGDADNRLRGLRSLSSSSTLMPVGRLMALRKTQLGRAPRVFRSPFTGEIFWVEQDQRPRPLRARSGR